MRRILLLAILIPLTLSLAHAAQQELEETINPAYVGVTTTLQQGDIEQTIEGNAVKANANFDENYLAIATNVTNISTNAANIATNAGDIDTLEDDVAENVSDITTNAQAAAANASGIAGKQATLVSGTNVKTVNGESLLGAGNLVIEGGDGGSMTYPSGTGIPWVTAGAWGTTLPYADLIDALQLLEWDFSLSGSEGVKLPPLTLDPYDANWDGSQKFASQGDVYDEMEQKVEATDIATAVDAIVYPFCVTINAATASSDFAVFSYSKAITITQISLNQFGGTNVIGMFQECTSAGATCVDIDTTDLTATTTKATDTAPTNAAIDAGDIIYWATTSVSGTNGHITACLEYTVD